MEIRAREEALRPMLFMLAQTISQMRHPEHSDISAKMIALASAIF